MSKEGLDAIFEAAEKAKAKAKVEDDEEEEDDEGDEDEGEVDESEAKEIAKKKVERLMQPVPKATPTKKKKVKADDGSEGDVMEKMLSLKKTLML